MGRGNAFVGCDGVKKHGDGPAFAHGGSGIILSRKAMSLLMQNYEPCLQKYSTCWAGDIRVSLCMRDLSIYLTTNVGFNGGSPDAYLFWPENACAKPFTFHHLKPKKMQGLLELTLYGGQITFGEVFQGEKAWGNASSWEEDVYRPGFDWKTILDVEAIYCRDLCEKELECVSFTWVPKDIGEEHNSGNGKGQCWTKKTMRPGEFRRGARSGVFPS
ncbi:hypothetical protein HK100_010568, partial [Physocladia obscura]